MALAVDRAIQIAENSGTELFDHPPAPVVRVCFLIDRLATGGTESQLLALIRDLDRSRVRPYLALLDGRDNASQGLEPADCRVLRLGLGKLLTLRTVKALGRFRRFLKEERIDIIQSYFPDSTYFGVLAGRLTGVRTIVRTRNNVNHWMTPTHRLLGRLLNRFVTLTVCNSEAGRQAVLADERPNPASVIVIENGVDLERFTHIPPVAEVQEPNRPPRVGIVANLRQVKGVDLFIRAAAQLSVTHSRVTFHVAGEGPQREQLERLIRELGLTGRLFLYGPVGEIPGFLAQLDIAVLSSRAEGMPNAVLEYMAAGRPIVATAVGGTPRLIQDGIHGSLVPPEDPTRLAEAIGALLDNPGLAARFGREARIRVERTFSRGSMVRRIEFLYGEVINL